MKDPDLTTAEARDLARLMSLDSLPSDWSDEDLAAVLRHQLAAPLQDELREVQADAAVPQDADDLRTVADLLHHPQPPIHLLRLAKQRMKDRGARADELFPRQVAAAVYLACICAAMLRCDDPISGADAAALRRRVQWALAQSWIVEPQLRTLLEEGGRRLAGAGG